MVVSTVLSAVCFACAIVLSLHNVSSWFIGVMLLGGFACEICALIRENKLLDDVKDLQKKKESEMKR